ncbi:hypothetical protein JOM56_015638 [Amanita muscaria]
MNANTAAGERNRSSRGLSRKHAVVFERDSDTGRIFIKEDNGEQLSQEDLEESELFELKNVDIVVSLSASLHCSALNFFLYSTCTSTNGIFNVPGTLQRCYTQFPQQGLIGMGGMGGNIRPPGKSRLSFGDIFSRLHGKRKKSENIRAGHKVLKQEKQYISDVMEARELHLSRRLVTGRFDDEDSDKDDAKSVMTVTGRDDKLECIDEEDKECVEHRDITEEIPEPTIGINMHVQSCSSSSSQKSVVVSPPSHNDSLPNPPDSTNMVELVQQVSALWKQIMATAITVNPVPKAQQATIQAMIQALEKKVKLLEDLFKATWQEQQTTATVPPPPPPTILVTPPPSIGVAKENEAETSLMEIGLVNEEAIKHGGLQVPLR